MATPFDVTATGAEADRDLQFFVATLATVISNADDRERDSLFPRLLAYALTLG